MLILMAILFINVVLYHVIKSYLIDSEINDAADKRIVVSSMKVAHEEWQPFITSVPELLAVAGVDITTEVEGKIQEIYVNSGEHVQQGDKILQLHAEEDIASLKALQAAADLAKVTYERDKEQYAINVVSKATLDIDLYNMQMQQALVDQQAALVNKKTIRAPFAGKIGLFYPNIGQYFDPGDFIVSLQSVNPIYAYFNTPEQNVVKLQVGQEVTLSSDTYPGEVFKGKITSLNNSINEDSHNITIETLIDNPDEKLLPGMFTTLRVNVGQPQKFLTIPQTAVSYNPYGNLVYVIEEAKHEKEKEEKKKKAELMAIQRFVTLGEKRGDQVAVLKGLKEGDQIVTSGQLKLKNKSKIIINNAVQPSNDANPHVGDHE